MPSITAQLTNHMESTKLAGGQYAPIADHAAVVAAAGGGVVSVAGETLRVDVYDDSGDFGWLLEGLVGNRITRVLGAGNATWLECEGKEIHKL